MRATVTKIQPGDKQSLEFGFMPEGKDKDWNLKMFGADKTKVNGIKVGDVVDVSVEKNSRGFWAVMSCSKVGAGDTSAAPATSGGSVRNYVEDPKKQENISRAVAIDKAITFVSLLVTTEKIKKSADPDLVFGLVQTYTDNFFTYLTTGNWTEGGTELTDNIPF